MYHHYLHGSCPPWDLYRLNSSYSSTAFLNCTSQHSCAHGLKALPAVQDSCEKIWRESYGSVQNECMIDLLCKYFFSYCSQMHICVWFFFFFVFLRHMLLNFLIDDHIVVWKLMQRFIYFLKDCKGFSCIWHMLPKNKLFLICVIDTDLLVLG